MNEKLRTELLSMRKRDISTRKKLADSGKLKHNKYHPEKLGLLEEHTAHLQKDGSIWIPGAYLVD